MKKLFALVLTIGIIVGATPFEDLPYEHEDLPYEHEHTIPFN
jgi:hypothetical protein